jgi:hypothetical protein
MFEREVNPRDDSFGELPEAEAPWIRGISHLSACPRTRGGSRQPGHEWVFAKLDVVDHGYGSPMNDAS